MMIICLIVVIWCMLFLKIEVFMLQLQPGSNDKGPGAFLKSFLSDPVDTDPMVHLPEALERSPKPFGLLVSLLASPLASLYLDPHLNLRLNR